eukprot:CAMPEP_0119082458 /NCGR_PEP_ID=MMETSP1178-20130426/121342_1 /TAXON_ID=33656 /ORGANISM="unid sp, Strain CCMP2000" /LENGTH=30 /DNA_ID= /DNA_START= /DNA_END= /DNA_ORIENTATION=
MSQVSSPTTSGTVPQTRAETSGARGSPLSW